MPTRRQEILDAAIQVLGSEGPRGLTHRAVDKTLRLPLGSTANVFGRRSELIAGIVERMEELDHAQGEHFRDVAGNAEELARWLTEFVRGTTSPAIAQTQKARYYLQFVLPEETAAARGRLADELKGLMAAAGAPPQRAEVVLATLDGLIMSAVTYGADALPQRATIEESLQLLMTSD